jgi:hypothetical protein
MTMNSPQDHPPSPEMRILCVEEQYRNPKFLDTRITMATKLGGKHLGSIAFLIIKKTSGWTSSLFCLSGTIGIIYCFGILPSELGWIIPAGPIHLFNFWALASPSMLKKLLFSFDVWYMSVQATFLCVGLLDAFMYDGRSGFIIGMWLSLITCIFLDAAHVSSPKKNATAIMIGILFTALFLSCIYFGVLPTIRDRDIIISSPLSKDEDNRISINTIFFTSDRLSTVLLFLGKNLWNAIRHPNYYLNLKARIMCQKVTAEELETKKSAAKKSVRKLSAFGSHMFQKNKTTVGRKALEYNPHKAPLGASGEARDELPNRPDPSDESSQHVQNREEDIVTTELNGLKLGDDDLVRVLMVEQDYMGFVVMDSSVTLVSMLLGKQIGGCVFAVIKKTGLLFLQMWSVAMVLVFACAFEAVPDWVGYVSLIMSTPLFFSFWALCNPHRLWLLVFTFETWYLTSLTTTAFAYAIYIFEHDGRTLALVCIWLCSVTAIWFDAAHISLIKHITIYFAVGVTVYMIFVVSLHLGLFPSVDNRDLLFSPFGVKVVFNAAVSVNDKLVLVLIFFCKNVYNSFKHPGCYITLKARIMHKKLRVRDLRQILQNNAGSVRNGFDLVHRGQTHLDSAIVAPEPVALSAV